MSVDALRPIDPATVGVLTESDPGGFPAEIWQGLDRRAVASLLRSLPAELASPVIRDLVRRLLLTSAAPPQGAAPPAGPDGTTLLGLRAERLLALGDTAATVRLLEVSPEGSGDALLDRTRIEANLVVGREEAACRQAREGVGAHGGAWWSKALVFCQLAAGEEDAAVLGLDLLREMGGPERDADFLALAGALMGLDAAPKAPAPTPLNLAMLAKLEARPDADWLAGLPLGRAEQAMGLQRAPTGPRVALAERAADAGALPGDRLADFYAAFGFADEALAGVDADAAAGDDPRGRALLFRAMAEAGAAPQKAELLRAYLSATRAADVPLAGLQAVLPAAVEMAPQPGLARWAAAPGRALFYGRQLERALAWVENARVAADQWPEAAGALRVLWPYARLAGTPTGGWADFADWARDAQAAGIDAQTVGLLAGALYGLGERDAPGESGLSAETGPPPETPQLAQLRDAGQAGNGGEVVLRVAALLGERGADSLHPLSLAAVVEALAAVGLEAEARRFAMEALVSRGL
jgi:hypothetical protein